LSSRFAYARTALQDASGNREFVGAVTDITERKTAEKALRASEAYLAEAQRLSHTGSWAWSPDTDVRHWSEECYRILGFDPRDGSPSMEEFIRRIHPDDQPAFRESANRAATHNKLDEEVAYRIVHPDGAVRDIHSIGHPVFGPSGDLIEYTGTVIDITERKRAEEDLRVSERKYRHLIDTTPAFIHTALPDGSLDFLSRGWLEYGGLPQTDILGWRWIAAIHPEDVEGFADKWRAALASGEPFEAESRVRRADGEYRWFLQRNVPLRDESGNIVKWYGTGIEIEERKAAEESLRSSEAYLAEAQRLSQTGSWAWSPDQDIRYWSEECYRVLSFDLRDGLPRFEQFFQRIHPDDRPSLWKLTQTAIREKAEWKADYRIVHPDGAVRDVHVVGHPVLSSSGDLVECVGTVIDVTERKRAEQERARVRQLEADLAHINRVSTLGEMAASLAHEVKQPIAAARNNARAALNFLAKKRPDLDEVREALGCIVGDADRAGDIIDRIRDHTKKAPARKDRFDLNEAITEVVEFARKLIHVDVLPADLDNSYRPTVELQGDIAATLKLLTPQLKRAHRSALSQDILRHIKVYKDDLANRAAGLGGTPIHPMRLVHELQPLLGTDITLCLDMGSFHLWMARHLYSVKARQILITNGQQTLGVALPWAIAASIVRPAEKVLSISVDGGFLFSAMELETAVRLKANIIHMVWIDGTYDMVRTQEVQKYGRPSGIELGPVDVVKYAEAFGAKGMMIRSPEEIAPVLKRALDYRNGPVLIGVHVDYSDNHKLFEMVPRDSFQ
jgi:PAS domain S-box-containing protein